MEGVSIEAGRLVVLALREARAPGLLSELLSVLVSSRRANRKLPGGVWREEEGGLPADTPQNARFPTRSPPFLHHCRMCARTLLNGKAKSVLSPLSPRRVKFLTVGGLARPTLLGSVTSVVWMPLDHPAMTSQLKMLSS